MPEPSHESSFRERDELRQAAIELALAHYHLAHAATSLACTTRQGWASTVNRLRSECSALRVAIGTRPAA
jgi:hypothetical protein